MFVTSDESKTAIALPPDGSIGAAWILHFYGVGVIRPRIWFPTKGDSMPNPQDNKRSDQSDKPKSGQQPTESDSKPESRHGQSGRPGESQDSMESSRKKKSGSDEDLDEDER
jgi:hypothetical protein